MKECLVEGIESTNPQTTINIKEAKTNNNSPSYGYPWYAEVVANNFQPSDSRYPGKNTRYGEVVANNYHPFDSRYPGRNPPYPSYYQSLSPDQGFSREPYVTNFGPKFREDKDKIDSFYIHKSPLAYYIPSGIADNFINLKVLIIVGCGLTSVRQSDLRPLTKLIMLNLDSNNLKTIDKDLFEYNPNIETVSLKENRIKSVAVDVFTPLTNLKYLNLKDNVCIQEKEATSVDQVKKLIEAINEKCSPLVLEGELGTSNPN